MLHWHRVVDHQVLRALRLSTLLLAGLLLLLLDPAIDQGLFLGKILGPSRLNLLCLVLSVNQVVLSVTDDICTRLLLLAHWSVLV